MPRRYITYVVEYAVASILEKKSRNDESRVLPSQVTGEGGDAGVVYCEMLAVENEQDEILQRRIMKELFGEGHS